LTNEAIEEYSRFLTPITRPGIYFLRTITRILRVSVGDIQREFGRKYGTGATLTRPYWLIYLDDCIVLNRIIPARNSRVFNRYTNIGKIEDAEEYLDL